MLELVFVVAIVTLLIGLAVRAHNVQFFRAQIAEAFALSAGPRIDMVIYRAEHGYWPDTAAELHISAFEPDKRQGRYVQRIIYVGDGAYSFEFGGDYAVQGFGTGQLGMQPMLVEHSAGSPIAWACGSHPAPAGMKKSHADTTSLDPFYLPYSCREK
ncbi:MAG: pilin [Pseudomonadota bacterium]